MKTAAYLLLFLIGLVLPPPQQGCDCGRRKTSRIVGGTTTHVNEFPEMVGIVEHPNDHVFCGGTIIANSYVLTSAHCLSKRNHNKLVLLIGDHDYNSRKDTKYAKVATVSSVKIHPKYNSKNHRNDIAIIKTKSPIKYNVAVGPVCLPFNQAHDKLVHQTVEAVGWGTKGFGGQYTSVLQKAALRVISNSECSQTYHNDLKPSQVCTYAHGRDACQMDSGGPIFLTHKGATFLAGIISYGISCGQSHPGVNTRVSDYLGWIQQNTGGVSFCRK